MLFHGKNVILILSCERRLNVAPPHPVTTPLRHSWPVRKTSYEHYGPHPVIHATSCPWTGCGGHHILSSCHILSNAPDPAHDDRIWSTSCHSRHILSIDRMWCGHHILSNTLSCQLTGRGYLILLIDRMLQLTGCYTTTSCPNDRFTPHPVN